MKRTVIERVQDDTYIIYLGCLFTNFDCLDRSKERGGGGKKLVTWKKIEAIISYKSTSKRGII